MASGISKPEFSPGRPPPGPSGLAYCSQRHSGPSGRPRASLEEPGFVEEGSLESNTGRMRRTLCIPGGSGAIVSGYIGCPHSR